MIFLISILAAFSYATSIFVDVSVYHLKYYIQDSKNVRFNLSLINIYQYSARAFVLIFIPAFPKEQRNFKFLNIK